MTSYRGLPSKRSALFESIGKATLSASLARRDIQRIPFGYNGNAKYLEDPANSNEFCRSIITKKIEGTILTLEKSIRHSDKRERAMKSAYSALARLEENPPETHYRIARIGSQLRRVLFPKLGWNADQMARHKPPANSRELEFHWPAIVALSFGRQSQCGAPGQCDIELRLCGARKRNSDQGHCRGL